MVKFFCNYRCLLVFFGFMLLPTVAFAIDINDMFATLAKNYPPLARFIGGVAYVTGFVFMVTAVYKLRAYGENRTMTPSNAALMGPLGRFIIGLALMFLPKSIDTLLMTLWGSTSVVGYPSAGWLDNFPGVKLGVLGLVQIFGYIALVRGLILMNRAVQQGAQPGSMGKGMTHMVGGILAINISGTINVIKASFGFVT